MGQLLLHDIAKRNLRQGTIPNNHIMVEAELTAEGKTTKGGIIIGHSEDATFYAEGKEVAWEADLAQVVAPVVKLPVELYYNREDPNHSMSWLTDMELQVGDYVWYNGLESRNAVAARCDGHAYKLIPYSDCYCAKRGDEVIMLNGYVLLERVYETNDSPLAVDKQGALDKSRGIVRYVGKPNREYLLPSYVDFQDLRVGDEVLLSPNTPLFLLERQKYMALFQGDELFWVVQRRRISMVLKRES